tara:strand:- start:1059 stop:1982 length:924 start_codon:yes stop_codon:yes gene_type:complete
MAEQTTFEFPDEIEAKAGKSPAKVEAPEIEIVDDTPAADRNRKPMTEDPVDPTDEEMEAYSESAKKRIKHFTKGYHEERRAKEAALREREEAVRIAQAIAEENRSLKGSLNQGQQALIEQTKTVIATELENGKREYKAAYEAGDSDALLAAQEKLTAAKLREDRVNNFRPAPLQDEKHVIQTQQAPVDAKAETWKESNEWFGSDDEMTSFALGLHMKLVKGGISPTSDEYYQKVDSRMRQVFPEKFDSTETADAPTPRVQKQNVVAPATRSTAPRKVVLTQSQVNVAKRLGVPLELYARKVAEEMRK